MKSYVQGFIAGGLLTFSIMILTGISKIKPEIGKFQISTTGTGDGFIVYETVINTKTGNVIRRNNIRAEYYKTDWHMFNSQKILE